MALGDDRVVLAWVGRILVHGVAEVHAVAEDAIGVALRQGAAALGGGAFGPEHLHQAGGGFRLDEAFEDPAHQCRLRLVHQQLAILGVVAEWHEAPHPDSARP